jgi:ferredoxin-NADP reductase
MDRHRAARRRRDREGAMGNSIEVTMAVRGGEPLAPNVQRIWLDVEGAGEFRFDAGQWVSLFVTGKDEKEEHRAYSIASAPGENLMELCVEVHPATVPGKSAVSEIVSRLAPGARVKVKGPYGDFRLAEASFPERLVLGAAGVGVAPIRSILRDLDRRNTWTADTVLHLEAISPDHLLYREEWEALAKKRKNFRFDALPLADDSAGGAPAPRGSRLLEAVRREAPSPGGVRVYLAGFNADLDASIAHLKSIDFPKEMRKYERYG